jgi:hypothetical protein
MAALLGERRTMLQSLPQHWQLVIPGRILGLFALLLLVRLALELTLGAEGARGGLLMRGLMGVTSPIVRAVGAITPRIVPTPLITPCAIFWLLTLRIVLAQMTALLAMRR